MVARYWRPGLKGGKSRTSCALGAGSLTSVALGAGMTSAARGAGGLLARYSFHRLADPGGSVIGESVDCGVKGCEIAW